RYGYAVGTIDRYRFQSNYNDDTAGIRLSLTATAKPEVFDDQDFYNDRVRSVSALHDGNDIVNANVCDVGYSGEDGGGSKNCGVITSADMGVTYGAEYPWASVTIPHAQ